MRRILLILSLAVLACQHTDAQGWKWGLCPGFNAAVSGASGFFNGPMAVDGSGNVFISGGTFHLYSSIFGPDTLVPEHYWAMQAVVAKSDSSGHFQWAVGAGGSTNASPVGIVTDASGNLYFFGSYIRDSICVLGPDTLRCPNGINANVFFLAKLDPAGHVLWAKNTVIPQGNDNVTSTFLYTGSNGGISIDAAGNIYITGSICTHSVSIGTDTLFNAEPGATSIDVFVAKLDSSGSPIWAKSYGGTDNDYINSIAVTPAGTVYLAGSYVSASMAMGSDTLTNAGSINNFFVAKLDSTGHPVWAKSVTGNPTINNDAGAITVDIDENLYFTGGFNNGPIHFGSVSISGSTSEKLFIVKYDSSGNVKWAKAAIGIESVGYGITADNCGNIWACGPMTSSLNFSGHTIPFPAGSYIPTYVAELDTAGNYINGMALTDGGGATTNILVDKRGALFVDGLFSNGITPFNFIIGPDTLRIDSQYQNLFVARYVYGDTDGCNIHATTLVDDYSTPVSRLSVYPNPTAKELTIVAKDRIDDLVISNVMGQVVYSHEYSSTEVQIDVSMLPTGIYFVKVNGSDLKKFLKE